MTANHLGNSPAESYVILIPLKSMGVCVQNCRLNNDFLEVFSGVVFLKGLTEDILLV